MHGVGNLKAHSYISYPDFSLWASVMLMWHHRIPTRGKSVSFDKKLRPIFPTCSWLQQIIYFYNLIVQVEQWSHILILSKSAIFPVTIWIKGCNVIFLLLWTIFLLVRTFFFTRYSQYWIIIQFGLSVRHHWITVSHVHTVLSLLVETRERERERELLLIGIELWKWETGIRCKSHVTCLWIVYRTYRRHIYIYIYIYGLSCISPIRVFTNKSAILTNPK